MPVTAAPGAPAASSGGGGNRRRGPPPPPANARRICADCDEDLPSRRFSTAQWWKKGENGSRCKACVGPQAAESRQQQRQFQQQQAQQEQQQQQQQAQQQQQQQQPRSSAARANSALRAHFTTQALRKPFAAGAFRWVAKGKYTQGARAGEACVCKWFKSGATFEESFFTLDILAVSKALEILESWNDAKLVNKGGAKRSRGMDIREWSR
jgi:Alpha-kinase family